ncbi:MAG: hypothetical protein ACP5NX_01205 [Candidatus Bilamarchaeaceae archaeon]
MRCLLALTLLLLPAFSYGANFDIGISANSTMTFAPFTYLRSLVYNTADSALYVLDADDENLMYHKDGKWFQRYTITNGKRLAVYGSDIYGTTGRNIKKFPAGTSVEVDAHVPYGLWVEKDYYYISDTENSKIFVVDRLGSTIRTIGGPGIGDMMFGFPADLYMHDGILYVADTQGLKITAIDTRSDFQFVRTYTNTVTGTGFKGPSGVYVDDEYIYVADKDGNKIAVLTKDGYTLYEYTVKSPTDIIKVGDTIYATQGMEKTVFTGTFHSDDLASYIMARSAMLAYPVERMERLNYLGRNYGVKFNYSDKEAADYKEANFAFSLGLLGRSYYLMDGLDSEWIGNYNAGLEALVLPAEKAAAEKKLNETKKNVTSPLEEGKPSVPGSSGSAKANTTGQDTGGTQTQAGTGQASGTALDGEAQQPMPDRQENGGDPWIRILLYCLIAILTVGAIGAIYYFLIRDSKGR